jgi:hypothetical protein
MASKDALRDIMEKLETPTVRWALVFIGVVILLRWKLVLFAAALPVMAYWHYSQQPEESQEQQLDEPSSGGGQRQDEFGDEDDDDGFGRDDPVPTKMNEDMNPWEEDFWEGDGPGRSAARRPAPQTSSRQSAGRPAVRGSSRFDEDDDLDFGFGAGRSAKAPTATKMSPSWDDDPSGGPLSDDIIPKFKQEPMEDDLASFGLGSGLGSSFLDNFGKADDLGFDPTFGLGGGGDMDFLSESMGSMFGRGGGKGKGKGKKDGGKGEKGPREADPKQLFVAGVGEASEDTLRDFFEQKGQVTRLKILKKDDGESKGVCFVHFATEEQAQDALSLDGQRLPGQSRNITVRLAGQNQNKGDKGGKGDRDSKGGGFRDRQFDRPPRDRDDGDFGGGGFPRNDRFGDLGDDRETRSKGSGGKGKGGRGRDTRSELDELIEEELASNDGALQVGDFDKGSRIFLDLLRNKDKREGTDRFHEAIRQVTQYTNTKERSQVRNWKAYTYTLLTKFDPELAEEVSAKKGGGKGKDRPDRPDRGFDRGFDRPTGGFDRGFDRD